MPPDNDNGNRKDGSPGNLKESEAALREKVERYALALQGPDDGIWDWDLSTGKVFFSDRWKSILGYAPDGISDNLEEWKSRIHPDDIDHVMAVHRDNFEGKSSHFEVEYRLRHKDGAYRWILGRGACVRDDKGVPIRAAGSHVDITGRKEAEETNRKNENLRRKVEKYEAIGHMAGGLAHHLNNLMTIVTGYSELLLSRLPKGDPSHEDIAKIRTSGERAAELIRQLLSFSRLQTLRPREVDVNVFLANLSTTLGNLAGRTVRFTFSPGDGIDPIRVDPESLRRTLSHLVSRARVAMPEGGEIRVATSAVEGGEPNAGGKLPQGRFALITVRDNGCGLDAKARDRIFEPFQTINLSHEGLELPALYGFVKQSGGYIFVDSRPGDGTTFRIYLPCLDRTSDPGAESENPPAGTPDAG